MENYYLLNLVFAVFLSTSLLVYLNRFNADHPVAGAFRRLLFGVMGWAFFDFFIDHISGTYPSGIAFAFFRYLSFAFLFYQAAALELILSLMIKIGKKRRWIIYSPFILFYGAAVLFPGIVTAGNFGIKGGYNGSPAPWNITFKLFAGAAGFSLLGVLLYNALHDADRPTRNEKLILFFGGFMTMSGVVISHFILKRQLPQMPLLGNLFTSLTSIGAFLGMKFYGRVLTERDLYTAVIKISPNGMIHLKKNRITWANRSTAEILGYDNADDLFGLGIEDLFGRNTYDSGEIRRLSGMLACGDLINEDVVLRKKDGSDAYCLLSGILFNKWDPLAGALLILVDISHLKEVEREKEVLIGDLQKALAEIKTLSGMLPICSYCKKIKDDSGYWRRLEEYIESRSDAVFSHSMCNDCMKKHHPTVTERIVESE